MKLNDVFKRLVLAKANDLTPPKQVGRKRSLTNNEALDLIFKVLRTGMQWREIDSPCCFTTVYRRMVLWEEQDVFTAAYKHALQTCQKLNPPKYYCVDSSYVKNMFGRQDTGRNHTDRGRQALKLSIVVDHNAAVNIGHRLRRILDNTLDSRDELCDYEKVCQRLEVHLTPEE